MSDNLSVWNKVNLNIDQVSQLTGVKKTTLRYWEKEFSDYLKPERTETKRRQYSMEELEKVSVLKQLIEDEKYKSAGVRLKLGLGQSAMGSYSEAAKTPTEAFEAPAAQTAQATPAAQAAPAAQTAQAAQAAQAAPAAQTAPRPNLLSPSPLPGVFFPHPLAKVG